MTTSTTFKIAVIGSGPAGLMAADVLSRAPRNRVTIYEAMPSVGRKFLMAGRGGLNLTHSESLDAFIERYGTRSRIMGPYIEAFTPAEVRHWCEALGQETFIGSSGRVFPKAMKATGLLRAWLRRLEQQGAGLRTRHRWTGWNPDGRLTFETPAGPVSIEADATVLALGGASWPRLGSNGAWVPILRAIGIAIVPLEPANCGLTIPWSAVFRNKFEGAPLKNIAINHRQVSARGEAIVTAHGLEGGAVYAISAAVRDTISTGGDTSITLDLKPEADHDTLCRQLAKPRGKQSFSNHLRKTTHLPPVAIALLHEAARRAGANPSAMPPAAIAQLIKSVTLPVTATASIDKAISTAGGIAFDELDGNLMLKKRPGAFAAGEMLDWEAPTGGYLLQACLATGAWAGHGAGQWLATPPAAGNGEQG